MFLPPVTSTSGSPAVGTPGGSTTRVSICHKSTWLWQYHTFWIATVHSRTTAGSFERNHTSCLRSASTRTCDQCTNRFTLASCCCTYWTQHTFPTCSSQSPHFKFNVELICVLRQILNRLYHEVVNRAVRMEHFTARVLYRVSYRVLEYSMDTGSSY